mgnify:CR=1 FL=1
MPPKVEVKTLTRKIINYYQLGNKDTRRRLMSFKLYKNVLPIKRSKIILNHPQIAETVEALASSMSSAVK